MADFRWFKNTETGKVGHYPARFASRPYLVEVDSSEVSCEECMGHSEEEVPFVRNEGLTEVELVDEEEVADEDYTFGVEGFDTDTKED